MPKKSKTSQKYSESPGQATALSIPKRHRRLFMLILAMFPVLFFIVLELLLRVTGYGKDIPVFVTFEANPQYYAVNPELGTRYFPETGVKPAVAYTDVMLKEKPRDAFRIFVLGGSTAAGYPYHYNGSISAILRAILAENYPDRTIEIVNLAMPAVSSYTVRDIALQLGRFAPDLLLIYAGHNEFYGGLGVGSTESLGNSRFLVNLYLQLSRLKVFQLLQTEINDLKGIFRGKEKSEARRSGTLMAQMAQKRTIPYDSKLFKKAGKIFHDNIADVIEFANQRQIPVLIATIASNVRDQPPFVDVFASQTDKNRWKTRLDLAQMAFASQKLDEAERLVQSCIALDSLPASQYFLLGKIHEAAGDTAAAYRAFYRAKDFDGLRFRAAEAINNKIRELSQQQNVFLTPVKRVFEHHSAGGIIGKSLMLEHLHPNLSGYMLMAKTFAEKILQEKFLGEPAVSDPDSSWTANLGVTEVDLQTARIRIDYLQHGWPFTHSPLPPKNEYRIPDATAVQQLALKFWNNEMSWEKLHVLAAEYFQKQGEWQKAAREYRAIIHASPMNPSPYIFLARVLKLNKKYRDAAAVLQAYLPFGRNQTVLQTLGEIYLKLNEPEAAVIYLKEALKLEPQNAQTNYLLAKSEMQLQNFQDAYVFVQQSLLKSRNQPAAVELAKVLHRRLRKKK